MWSHVSSLQLSTCTIWGLKLTPASYIVAFSLILSSLSSSNSLSISSSTQVRVICYLPNHFPLALLLITPDKITPAVAFCSARLDYTETRLHPLLPSPWNHSSSSAVLHHSFQQRIIFKKYTSPLLECRLKSVWKQQQLCRPRQTEISLKCCDL